MTNLQHHHDKPTFLERLIFNNRPTVIGICLLVSIFLFWQATLVRPSTSFEKMIPLGHPFIQNMMEHRNDLANLGNTVRISVEAKQGDIFSREYMETLRQINDEVFYISGVDRSGLKSLWSPSVRWTEVTEEGFAGGEVIPQSYDGSQESLDRLRNNDAQGNQPLLEYGACGYPVICSNVRAYQGDLPVTRVANTTEAWVDAIRAHLHDLSTAARIGDQLRATVLRDWMLDDQGIQRWREVWLP
jgi:hypothetical protein